MDSVKYSPVAAYELEEEGRTPENDRQENSPTYRGRRMLAFWDKSTFYTQQRRCIRWTMIVILILVVLSWTVSRKVVLEDVESEEEFGVCPRLLGPAEPGANQYRAQSESYDEDQSRWSKTMLPSELMQLIDEGKPLPPRIIHQSWKTRDNLPPRFHKWSNDWRRIHGDRWTHVLWSDDDNRELIKRFYPEYLETYNKLPREIYRADMVRNVYMHRFGGIYSDLDLRPLGPIDEHLAQFLVPVDQRASMAFVGRMGDEGFEHSIPNAFMASTKPGHPFWLEPLRFVAQHQEEEAYNREPERLTGPVALRYCIAQWQDAHFPKSHGEVVVLPDGKIYPFNWDAIRREGWCLCRPHSPWFNEDKCNTLYEKTAWTITYWTHIWE